MFSKQQTAIDEHTALLRLAALCARGEHSSGEMRTKMRRWLLPEDAQERVLERLVADGYVDDERFARIFVRDKLRFNHWGRAKIAQALHVKGVAADIASRLLDDVSDEEWLSVLRPLLEQKARSVTGRNDYERRGKLIRFALGRGFQIPVISRCIPSDGLENMDGDDE